MAYDHPFDAPANHQLQEVLSFVARKTNINDKLLELHAASSTSPSPPQHRHTAAVPAAPEETAEPINCNSSTTSRGSYKALLSSTPPILSPYDPAVNGAMALNRKVEEGELEKITRPFLSDELVTVRLIKSKNSFTVSSALLCHESPYFTKALKGGFKEAKKRELRLPGCDDEIFELLIHYMATGAVPDDMTRIQSLRNDDADDEANTLARSVQKKLIKIWTFAEFLTMPVLQNVAMSAFLDAIGDCHIESEYSKLAYDTTSRPSVLRSAIVDESVSDFMGEECTDHFNDAWFDNMSDVKEFLCDFAYQLSACSGKLCEHAAGCAPSGMEDQSEYMVPEN